MNTEQLVAQILAHQDPKDQIEAILHQRIQEKLDDRKIELAQDIVKTSN
jgi:dephospho-CoA kinase